MTVDAGHPNRRIWPSILTAVGVGGVLVAIVIGAWQGGHGIPASPAAPPASASTTIEIDLFSGRPNPVMPMDARAADVMYEGMLADQAGYLVPGQPPDLGLGFRGLVVRSDAARPVLRIRPHVVYVERRGPDGEPAYEVLDDPHQIFYRFVLSGIRETLSDDVLDALGEPVPPPGGWPRGPGDPGIWTTLGTVTPESTEITLGVTRLGCSSGVTGEVLTPVVDYSAERILILTNVAPWGTGVATCPDNDVVPVTVRLKEPIGRRDLVDVACLATRARDTTFCADGPVRWSP